MAVTLGPAPRYQWQGLSTDTKPTGNTVDVNQLFFETDTGKFYIFNGVAWNVYSTSGGGGGGGSAPAFTSSVTDAAPGASDNNYSPTGYVGGTTNRLLVTAASGGTTLTGLVAATDGWNVYIRNMSTTDNITLAHLSASSTAANRFSCPQGVNAIIAPLTGTFLSLGTRSWHSLCAEPAFVGFDGTDAL